MKAEEAYRIGLAQWLVPHDTLMAQAMEVAEHIASLPPLATRLTKESLNRGIDVPLADAVLGDLYRFAMLEMTEDKQEAHQAWRERRKPRIQGKLIEGDKGETLWLKQYAPSSLIHPAVKG